MNIEVCVVNILPLSFEQNSGPTNAESRPERWSYEGH
jgi:hypothetical protein